MRSEERRAGRRARRDAARAAKRAARTAGRGLAAVADMESLYKAQRQAARGVGWKASTQRYRIDWLLNAHRTRRDLLAGVSVHRGFHEFDVLERGKARHIAAVCFAERVPQKALAHQVLVPCLTPSLIDRNSANRKGRGLDYAVRALKRDLVGHWRRHGSEGWVLLVDFKGYFDSIDHGHVELMLREAVDDPGALDLALRLLALQGGRGLGLGCEPNQIEAVALPSRLDHYVCEVLRPEAYGRYMDDAYMIDPSKERLARCLAEFRRGAEAMGLELNPKKTRIVRLSKGFAFLKRRWSYTDTGRVLVRPARESVARERRKLKRLAGMAAAGKVPAEAVERSYMSWRGQVVRLDAHRTVLSMDRLYKTLMGEMEEKK